MSLFRKILMTLMVIGGIGSSISAGTYASFNATTNNASSTFQTGTLVLDRKVGATSCLSVGAGTNTDTNANTSCGVTFSQSRMKPGETSVVNLTLENKGTIGGTISLQAEDVVVGTAGVQVCATATNTISLNWNLGTGDLCGVTRITIQEHDDNTFASPKSACVLPFSAGSACSIASGTLLSALPTPSSPLAVTGTFAGSTPRYFTITLRLDSSASDQMQGRLASFKLTWTLAS